MAMRCSLDAVANISVTYVDFHTVPLETQDITRILLSVADQADFLLVSFGIWYNWRFDVDNVDVASIDVDYTRKFFARCTAKNGIDLKLPPVTNQTMMDYSYARRSALPRCDNLDLTAFVSDVKRFARAVASLRTDRLLDDRLRIIWRRITPQHFAGSAHGQYDLWRQQTTGRCEMFRNESAAFARNAFAERALGEFFALENVTVFDTWQFDNDQIHLHLSGTDCTHYCPAVSWHWTLKFLDLLETLV